MFPFKFVFYVVDFVLLCFKMNDFDFSPSFFFSRAVDYDEEDDEAIKDVDWCVGVVGSV